MNRTSMVGTIGATLMIALTLDARPADAQLTKAGVVVGLEGDAKVQRLGAPAPAPLQFRDDVFVRDRATTGENSRARFLLGGKAVLTMRERSVVTITETPSSSTVDIASGRFALAVAKERLKPGEVIEIRTPNAVAGIRGTVVIAEVFQASAQAGGPPAAGFSTRFLVVRGVVEVTAIDPATGRPTGNPVTLDQNDAVTVTGSGIGAPQAEAPGQVQQLASIYSAPLNVGIGTAAVNDAQTEDHKKLWRHDRSNKRERIRDLDPGERGRGPDKDRDVPDNFRPSFGNPDKRNNPLNPIGGVPGNAAPGGPGKSGGNGGGGNSNGGGGGSSGSSGGGGATGVISGGVISGASSGPGNSGGHGRGRGPNH